MLMPSEVYLRSNSKSMKSIGLATLDQLSYFNEGKVINPRNISAA
jgi:hypothetical protein